MCTVHTAYAIMHVTPNSLLLHSHTDERLRSPVVEFSDLHYAVGMYAAPVRVFSFRVQNFLYTVAVDISTI